MSNPLALYQFEGDDREIGRAHGEALRGEIADLLERRSHALQEMGGQSLEVVADIASRAGFLEAANRWTPHLVDEIRGIGEGANLTFPVAFAWQLLDELEWLCQAPSEIRAGPGRCSALSVFGGDGATLLAQNADMGASFEGSPIVVHLTRSAHRGQLITVTVPGVCGLWGMNHWGVGLCLNAMDAPGLRRDHGLATSLVARRVLESTSLEAAEQFLRAVDHATQETYTLGAPGQAACFECSPRGTVRLDPWPAPGLICHTNHPLAQPESDPNVEGRADSEARLEAMVTRLGAVPTPVESSDLIAILSSHDDAEHPICRHEKSGSDALTTFAVAMELDAQSLRLAVCAGRPCCGVFQTFSLDPATAPETD